MTMDLYVEECACEGFNDFQLRAQRPAGFAGAGVSGGRAHAQAEALHRVQDNLTEAEADVVRRARNAHQNPPKNADPGEYHHATALEALIGWLYVTGQGDRMNEVLRMALPEIREQAIGNRQ